MKEEELWFRLQFSRNESTGVLYSPLQFALLLNFESVVRKGNCGTVKPRFNGLLHNGFHI